MRVHTSSTAENTQRDDTQPRTTSRKITNKGPQTPSSLGGVQCRPSTRPPRLECTTSTIGSLLSFFFLFPFNSDPVTAEILYCLATVGGASIVADVQEGRLLSADWPGVTADPGPSPAPCGSPSLNLVHSICPDGPA